MANECVAITTLTPEQHATLTEEQLRGIILPMYLDTLSEEQLANLTECEMASLAIHTAEGRIWVSQASDIHLAGSRGIGQIIMGLTHEPTADQLDWHTFTANEWDNFTAATWDSFGITTEAKAYQIIASDIYIAGSRGGQIITDPTGQIVLAGSTGGNQQ